MHTLSQLIISLIIVLKLMGINLRLKNCGFSFKKGAHLVQ